MATGSTRDVKMVLSVESLGQENITKLQQALRDLAATGDAGTAEFSELADQIGRLGDQGAALQSFKNLSAETDALRERQAAAGMEATQLAARLDAARLAADRGKESQQEARQALVAGEKAYTDAGNALRALKAEYDAAGRQTSAYRTRLQELVGQQNVARTALIDLREANRQATAAVTAAVSEQSKAETVYKRAATQYDAAGKAVEKQVVAFKQAGDAAKELGIDVTDLAQAEAELLSTFARGTTTLTTRRQAVEEMAEADRLAAIEAQGLTEVYRRGEAALQAETLAQRDAERAVRAYTDAKNLATSDADAWQREAEAIVDMVEAQQRTRAETERLVRSLQELRSVDAFEQQAREAQKLVQASEYVRALEDAFDEADREQEKLAEGARRLNAAFAQIETRSIEQVKVEIDQTSDAMRLLAESGRLTGGALAVAMDRGTQKINALQREVRELSGALTLADRAAGVLKNSLGQIAVGNIIADGVGYLVEKVKELGRAFIDVTLQTESTRKAFVAIYKDAGLAAAQMEFLRGTAGAAGVSFSGLTTDFVRFSAAASGANIPVEQSNALFTSLTRAASSLGLGAEKTALALNALGQIASKGVVSMEELRQQLGDSVPGALSLTAKGLNITDGELIKLVETGQLAARDFFPAFTEGLKTMQGETDGVLRTWERFKNVLALGAVAAESNGALVLLTGTLKVLGGLLAGIALGLSVVVEALLAAGRGAILFFETLRGNGKEAFGFFQEESAKMVDRLTEQANAFNAMLDPSEENLARLEASAAASSKMAAATAAATGTLKINTTELTANAAQAAKNEAGALALAKANLITQSTTLGLSEQWVKLNVEMTKLATQQEANVVVSGKLADAAEQEGIAAIRLAKLKGDEVGVLQATAEAATRNSAAINAVATAREAEAAVLRIQADEMAKLAILQDGSIVQREAEIKAITDKVEKLDAEAAAARNAAEASRIEAAERELLVKLYEDNSAAVGQLQKARDDAAANLQYAIDLEKLGLRTTQDVTAATEELAKASRLYDDALKDSIKNLDLATRAKTADLSITGAMLSAEQRLYERLAASARAQGDNAKAIYFTIEAKQREIKQIELSVQIKGLEIAADRQSIEIQKQALDVADPLYKQKVKELDIRLKLLQAQEIENKSKLGAISAIQKEIENLRIYGNEKGKATEKTRTDTKVTDQNTASKERNAEATEKQAEAERKRLNIDKDGFSTDKEGNRLSMGGDLNSLTGIAQFLKSAGVDDGNAKRIATEFSDGKGNIPYFSNPGQMKYGGPTSTISQALLKAAETITFAGSGVGRPSGVGSDDTAEDRGKAKGGTNVTINIGGKRRTVGVSSQADANTLASVLRDLENQSGTAA